MEGLFAELIIAQALATRAQGKTVRRDKNPQRAALLTNGAVACNHAAQVSGDLKAYLAAMTAPGVGFCVGHCDLHLVRRLGRACETNIAERVPASVKNSTRPTRYISCTAPSSATSKPSARISSRRASMVGFICVSMIERAPRSPRRGLRISQVRWPLGRPE